MAPFMPARLEDFGPQDSCLPSARPIARRIVRLGPSDQVARPSPVRLPAYASISQAATAKRRLSPAHATSPNPRVSYPTLGARDGEELVWGN